MRARRLLAFALAAALLAAAAALAALVPGADARPARAADTRLNLVGYAVPREALGAVIKQWQETPDGRDVSFSQSYGASGDQAPPVEQPAGTTP